MKDKIQSVIDYHERTKHHPQRYAASPGFMDWANEPDPFRRYEGATRLSLPLSGKDPDAEYRDLYERARNPVRPFSLENISTLLELSLGLSAWKSYGGTGWALRMNPSSGNLHPTEAYVVLGPLPETNDRGGVYHYSPFLHALEVRAAFDAMSWHPVANHFGTDGFFIGLSSIYWRESWKYGERAFRYCNHDIGHAMAALSFAGNLLGWKVTHLNSVSDEDIRSLLGLRKTDWIRFEEEEPAVLFFVHPNPKTDVPGDMPQGLMELFRSLSYSGRPNRLSRDHRQWREIEKVSSATEKPRTPQMKYRSRRFPFFEKKMPSNQAASIIRQRRSAAAFDGSTALHRDDFMGMLDRTVPRGDCAPFDLGPGEPSVHLLIFVHRVSGMESGLYFFLRDEKDLEEMRRSCRHDFLWQKMDAPQSVHLYLLKRGDFRSEGATAG